MNFVALKKKSEKLTEQLQILNTFSFQNRKFMFTIASYASQDYLVYDACYAARPR